MPTIKSVNLALLVIILTALLVSQQLHAEIFKWVDDKGTVHFTQDPSTIPEKYRDRVKSRTTEEDLMTPEERLKAKKQEEERARERQRSEGGSHQVREPVERTRKQEGSVEIVNWSSTVSSLGIRGWGDSLREKTETCATITIRNGTFEEKTLTERNILAITSRKVGTRFEMGRASNAPGRPPIAIESSDRFTPKPFLVRLAPGQTETISACFGRDLPIAKVELRGL